MRIKPIMKYYASTAIRYIVIFYSVILAVILIGALLAVLFSTNIHILGTFHMSSDGGIQSWSMSILPFVIFMIVLGLGIAQKDTRFLITRSVSRKEIFITNAIYIIPITAIMALLQLIIIYLESGLNLLITGYGFRGVIADFQSFQAPNMTNPIIFFLVSMAILLSFSTMSYLIGTFYAKWKIPTIVIVAVSAITGITCIVAFDGLLKMLINAFTFMFTDADSGLWIVLKHIIFSTIIMSASFPIMRRITAAKNI